VPPAEQLWFKPSLEGLFARGLTDVLTPDARLALKAEGVDVERLPDSVPLAVFTRALDVVAPLVAPERPRAEQLEALGRRFTHGYFDTMLGAAMSLGMRLVGPYRAIPRSPKMYRAITNYIDARVSELSPTHAVLEFSPVTQLGPFFLGMGQGSFALLHRGPVIFTTLHDDGERFVSRVDWT
jgi:uncharacterized protein (TIGR02265 family)